VQAPLAPQWAALVSGSTQLPSHFTSLAEQTTVQAPPLQTWLEPQASPAEAPVQAPLAPQEVALVSGSTQAPPHQTWPDGQAQVPLAQAWPVGQAAPAAAPEQSAEAPQWVALVSGSMQPPSHFTWLAAQTTVQAPAEQTWPEPQAAPASAPPHAPLAPQWVRLVRGSRQVPSHFTWLTGQTRAQAPALQTWVAPQAAPASAPLQAPLAPQWVRLVCGSTQAPSQETCPVGQLPGQSLPEQTLPEEQAASRSRRTGVAKRNLSMVDSGARRGARCALRCAAVTGARALDSG
jgi:hypothetical protein